MALDPDTRRPSQRMYGDALHPQMAPSNLADILERVLDKGIVIAGDIQLNLLDIELITIKIRLLIASVDRAREMGINWWESDPTLAVQPREERVEFRAEIDRGEDDAGALEARIERLERLLEAGGGDGETAKRGTGSARGGSRATRPTSARRATGSRGGNAKKR
ncbi:MAG TPA: gas vesicle protein [Solirubrobacteraceae bacterium]|nr:gas vesicle protein [Solirubrobacteraceae bacterium]